LHNLNWVLVMFSHTVFSWKKDSILVCFLWLPKRESLWF
jgi:hypothetical protein